MALDPVPWFVGSGAKHSAATARNLAWNATGGKTGIATPDSLLVRALSTPGGAVEVMPGGAVVESTYQGALQQSYTVRNAEAAQVSVDLNSSDAKVSDYIYIIIEDPTYAGDDPPSVAEGPYNRFVAGASQGTHPSIGLAKIVQPPHTTAITNEMIEDIRVLANPRREEIVFGRPRITADSEAGTTLNRMTDDGGEYFPGGSGSPNLFEVDVPVWANRVMIDAQWMAVRYEANTNPYGSYWVEFGDEYRSHTWPNNRQYEYATQAFKFNGPGTSNDVTQVNWLLMDARPIVSKFRGKKIKFAFKAGYINNNSGSVSMDAMSGLGMRVTFAEVPDDNPDVV